LFSASDRNPQLVFGAIEDQPNPAIAIETFRSLEWNWVVLPQYKVFGNGATRALFALCESLFV